jgi:hypothetical protein
VEGSKKGMSETQRPPRIRRRRGAALAGLLTIIVALHIVLYVAMDTALNGTAMDAKQGSLASKDGTIIAYEQPGAGPAIIPVAGALADGHTGGPASHLHFASNISTLVPAQTASN